MPRQRFKNLDGETRTRLLAIATAHFARHGFERASLNEILAQAGISKGSYYYYFDDKDDLFATALEAAFDALLSRLPIPSFEALTPDQFWPTVEIFVGQWALAFDVSGDLIQAAVQLTSEQRRSRRFAPMLARAQALYRMLIEPGQRLGCVRRDLPVEVLVRLLEANDAVLDGLFVSADAKVTRARLDEHVRLVFDTFKRLLMTELGQNEGSRAHRPAPRPRQKRRKARRG